MYCANCGSPVGDKEKFCSSCGTPVVAQAAAPVAQQPASQPVQQLVQQPAPQPVQQSIPQPAPVVQPAPVMQPAPQPVPVMQPVPAVYQQPVPQPVPMMQPVQTAPRAFPQTVAPALADVKAGPRKACFVIGLITCILLIIVNLPSFVIGGMMFFVGPLAMMLGASNSEDIFLYGMLICLGTFVLIDAAVVSIVFNGISTKITARRPASKCRTFRMAAAIIVLADALITVAPIIWLNDLMSGAEVFYAIFAVVFIMAIVYMVLAVITNKKEKQLASESSL